MSAATTSGRTPASPQGRHAPRHRIQWTDRLTRGILEHMCVNHRRAYITVSQELLHRTDIGPALQELRRTDVPQRMHRGMLEDARLTQGKLQSSR